MDERLRKAALRMQQDEITESYIYAALAERERGKNRDVLRRISADEKTHYEYWRTFTCQDLQPKRGLLWVYKALASVFGVTFVLRLMEAGEKTAQEKYREVRGIKGLQRVIQDEERHEQELISMLKDERLEYAGSIVLGLNDALVELTGALAGLSLALRDGTLVAVAGLVTGLAASLSMAASAYLHSKEDNEKSPLKSAVYTGVAYLVVVAILITPYFVFSNIFASLAVTLGLAVLVVAGYTFYISVAKDQPFWRRFAEMAIISLVVAAISFGFGLLLNHWLGVAA